MTFFFIFGRTFSNLSVDADTLLWEGQLRRLTEELKNKKVNQLMSTNVTSAALDEHIIVILDKMIKNKFRRLPVLEGNKPIGIIYLFDVYYRIFSLSSTQTRWLHIGNRQLCR